MKNVQLNISSYATLVFDCDGVLLDSNKAKTQAFFQAALPYGETAAQALADYHVANGGISRYKKFTYFLERIAPKQIPGISLDVLLATYAENVRNGLLNCKVAPGLMELRKKTPNSRWLIVSGGDQSELREIFENRNLASMFDGGIFGSPDTKEEILVREKSSHNIVSPSLFIGDSKYDHKVATAEKIDFLFMSNWSEVVEWEKWCQEYNICSLPNIASILD